MGLRQIGYRVTIKQNCTKAITRFPNGKFDPSFKINRNIMKKEGVRYE